MQLKNQTPTTFMKWGTALVALYCGISLTACKRENQAPPAMTVEVATVTVKPQSILLTTELPGRTSPFRIADIRPQINGLVQKRLFTEGSDVKEGQQLYQIDPAPYQAAYDAVKATIPALRSKVERYTKAMAEKAISQQDYDDSDSAYKQALASLETARINLAYASVASPISGRIGTSSVTDGAIVTSYQTTPLATIQQLDPMYVDIPQATADMLRLQRHIKEGLHQDNDVNKVQIILEDGSKYPLEGTLQFRDVTVDTTTASVILRVVVPNPNGVLLPGMFVRTVVKEGINPKAILIPQQTVARDTKGNPYVLIVNSSNVVEQRAVVLDRAMGSNWMVTSGLNEGDQLIAEGGLKTRPGATVKAVPFEDKKAAAQPAPSAK
ncbi:MAG: efflux RND transporter periplasmic adaptor subunit [Chthoniobacteraceae bacterium]